MSPLALCFIPDDWSADDRVAFLELINDHLSNFSFTIVYEVEFECFFGYCFSKTKGHGNFEIYISDLDFYDKNGKKSYTLNLRTQNEFIREEVLKAISLFCD